MNTTISTRQKIGTLIKKFLRYLDDSKNTIFEISILILESSRIFKDIKKALDIVFYLEGLGILLRISSQHIIYVGFKGMTRKLYQYQKQIINHKPIKLAQEILLDGRLTSIRNQILAGSLLANIFYTLIYKKQSLTKSSVEQMAQNYIMQQKQLNSKIFILDLFNLFSTLNLIEKNQSTQVIHYIGPDLKIYDQNNRKISWKIYQLMRRQELAIGKESNGNTTELKQEIVTQPQNRNAPISVHMSYFPQLSYGVLRSNNWQKNITKTIFFIGRDSKNQNHSRRHQVDLQLSYKSVSRQHAVILFNFEATRWEIRCLSKKNLIKVDNQRYTYGDQNVWLKNKSQIQIGPEKFIFLETLKINS